MSSAEGAFADGVLVANRTSHTPKMMKMTLSFILAQCEENRWAHKCIQRTNNRAIPLTGRQPACQIIADLIAKDKHGLNMLGERSAPCWQVRPYCPSSRGRHGSVACRPSPNGSRMK